MKHLFAFFAACLLLAPASALAGPQDFTLVNGSASHLCYVYVSPSNSDDWEEDILGADECLSPGESLQVSFTGGSRHPIWDLRIEDENGNYEDYRGFNLNRISSITIQGGGKANYR